MSSPAGLQVELPALQVGPKHRGVWLTGPDVFEPFSEPLLKRALPPAKPTLEYSKRFTFQYLG